MALNPNHAFEDLGDVKCAIVEKNCTPARAEFLKKILEHNSYKVVVVTTPVKPAKAPAAKPAPKPAPPTDGATPATPPPPQAPEAHAPPPPPDTFTVGVTDVTFNPINAVFNRELKTPDGEILTSDYWKQRETKVRDEEWYWSK